MSRWFRHYAGMMRDEKLVRAALKARQPVERVVWVYGVILESAAEIDDAGRYELDHAEVAYFLRADEADIANIEIALGDLGRVHDGHVAKWSTRQFQSDRSTERTKRYRDRHKTSSDGIANVPVTACDDVVTSQERLCDTPETETEANTDKKDISAVAKATRPAERFEEFWRERPRRKGDDPRKPAEDQFARLVKSGEDPNAIIAGVKLARLAYARDGKIGTEYVPQMQKWLRDRRYRDFAEDPPDAGPADDGLIEVTDSDALDAWDAYGRQQYGKTFPRNSRGGWRFPVLYPPGYEPPAGEASPPVIPRLPSMSSRP